jgi:hypothetical protein
MRSEGATFSRDRAGLSTRLKNSLLQGTATGRAAFLDRIPRAVRSSGRASGTAAAPATEGHRPL